jgi:hypothetical protein
MHKNMLYMASYAITRASYIQHKMDAQFFFYCYENLIACYPEGCAAPGEVPCQCNT